MSSMRIRTKWQTGKLLVRILIEHPMETGRRPSADTGKPAPAHFITELNVELDEKPVMQGRLSTAISQNPYFSLRLNDARPGQRLRVSWLDNLGQRDSQDLVIAD